jgi:hypothetical protein
MKIQKAILVLALGISSNVILAAHYDHHHGRRGGHHNHCDCNGTSATSKIYRVKVAGLDYKLSSVTDSTVKVNDNVYPLKSVARSVGLVNWTDKNGAMLSNVIDWHHGKMYTTQLSADKKASIITSDILEETTPVAPSANDKNLVEPVKKN